MAIDTQDKRRAAVAHTIGALMIAPVPDSTVGTADRMHIAGFYRYTATSTTPVSLAATAVGVGTLSPAQTLLRAVGATATGVAGMIAQYVAGGASETGALLASHMRTVIFSLFDNKDDME